MNRFLSLFLALGLVAWAAGGAYANLLVNPDLDDPGDHEVDLAIGWTLDEYRSSGPADTATFARFGNHTPNPNAPGPDPDMTGTGPRVGLWLKNFSGSTTNPASADLYQDVSGTPGMKYIMTGWARFEQFYAGGINNYPVFDPNTGEFTLVPSPTDTFFALDFLDGGGGIISTEDIELRANGQINDGVWRQHMLMAVAPAGTATVRVRASAVDMVNVSGSQSAFADDFSLICVPEPATVGLTLIGLVGVVGLLRRR